MANDSNHSVWTFHLLCPSSTKKGQLIADINYLIANFTQPKGSESDANQIVPGVWLGNYQVANDLQFVTSKKIVHIINATKVIQTTFAFVDYTIYPLVDSDACEHDVLGFLMRGAKIINARQLVGSNILVHCKSGHHRSASIVAMYLMVYHGMSLVESVHLIKSVRPTAFRRMNCMLQTLINYELSVRS